MFIVRGSVLVVDRVVFGVSRRRFISLSILETCGAFHLPIGADLLTRIFASFLKIEDCFVNALSVK